jgi:hypothetical protein
MVVNVDPPITTEVEYGDGVMTVGCESGDSGKTNVHGGKHWIVGLGSTKMVGSMYTTPDPPFASLPSLGRRQISPPPSARTSQALISVVY